MRAVISDAVWVLGRAVHRVADWVWNLSDVINGPRDTEPADTTRSHTVHVHTEV